VGFGVWVFGFGGLGPTPNPQSPIPNPPNILYENLILSIIKIQMRKNNYASIK